MAKNSNIDCQSTKVCIVIRKNCSIDIEQIKKYCNTYFSRYAFIEHKNDKQPVSGVIEGTHYHIVGDFIDSKVRFSRRLNDIVSFFKFDNAFGIEIDKYINLSCSIQYLTHKNQKDKTQHNMSEIITNIPKDDLNILYNADNGVLLDFDSVYAICVESITLLNVIKQIGFNNYHKYRATILDIFSETRSANRSITNKVINDDLPF